ncbi:MAG: sigma-70 family RNA polymerase sigma factor [Thermoactinospora sp.]|nr:sigma-70 family RNA polymerase sigma factor [Thermoactinospora sp.]
MSEVLLKKAREGDDDAFARLVGPLRGELHAHCYRMLGSPHDADDALQETMVKAWKGLRGFEERGSLRAWMYSVATRTCIDAVNARGRRALPVDLGPASEQVVADAEPLQEVRWLEPYPDAGYERRETVELAFVAALQHLPGNQRAALLLFEVLGFSAAEIATMMETTVTSVNSALSRARRLVADRVPEPSQQQTLRKLGDGRLRQIVEQYTAAMEEGDAGKLVALLTEDVTWSMPPLPSWYTGVEAVMDFAVRVPLTSCGSWRIVEASANGQPAMAAYLWNEREGRHLPWSVTVLTLRGDRIAALTSFIGVEHFRMLGLPVMIGE